MGNLEGEDGLLSWEAIAPVVTHLDVTRPQVEAAADAVAMVLG